MKKRKEELMCGICGDNPVYGTREICKDCAEAMAKSILQIEEEEWLKTRRKKRK